MTTIIRAIETKYKGYRFRSRLEARWAVFFDALGVQWEYEPEGFDLRDAAQKTIDDYYEWKRSGEIYDDMAADWWDESSIEWLRKFHGKYLPDFYLHDLRQFVEIKPYQGPDFYGNPEHSPIRLLGGILVHGTPGGRDEYEVCVFYDNAHWFGYCPVCKVFGYGFLAWAERICKDHEKCGHYRKFELDETPPMIEAIKSARSARFERGDAHR